MSQPVSSDQDMNFDDLSPNIVVPDSSVFVVSGKEMHGTHVNQIVSGRI